MNFAIDDEVGAWVPHGRFVIEGRPGGALAGLRFAAKDLFDVAGHPTGAGNPTWLATHPVPARHSEVVARLLDAGATLAGKVVTDELAYSLHGDNLHYGAPINARAQRQVTGGSSSGSAAAVAAGLVDFALGTDTGGSTRVPASYCGLWGLRSTHGLVPAEGLVPLHPSFDTVTWLAQDPTTFERDALAARLDLALETLRIAGAEALADWRQTYATAGAFEGWQVHGAWIRAHRPVFGPAIAARWQAASQVDDAAAATARAAVLRIRARVRTLLGDDGVAVLPSAASVAPCRDADAAVVDVVRMRTMAITCIAGLAGLPQVSIPLSAPDGLPLGVSLLGPAGSDLALIRLAAELYPALV